MRIAARAGAGVIISAAVWLVGMPLEAKAEVVVDGSLSPRTALAGPNFAVTADLGRQVGANLFHSFSRFNLAAGESAAFSGPASVVNIVGRVTGGAASQIDGLLRSTISNANLYLVNPWGIVFGPNAALDVSGSFHASSADYLKFADAVRFDARASGSASLTSAPPAAFGFLGPSAAAISATGATLNVPAGQSLSLVGGDIRLDGAILQAPSGRVNLASLASAGEIAFDAGGIAAQASGKLGALTLANSWADASSSGTAAAGGIYIRGGRLVLASSSLFAFNAADSPSGPIRAILDEAIALDGGTLYTSAGAGGKAGAIELQAPSVGLDNGALVNSSANAAGSGGGISIAAARLTLGNGAYVQTATTGPGAGGAIAVAAGESVSISGTGSRISAASSGDGAAGALSVQAPSIRVSDGASIASDTSGRGAGGAVLVKADELQLLGDGSISAVTQGAGSGGVLDISARQIAISGGRAYPGGIPDPATGLTYFGYYSGLYASSQFGATGNAGAVKLKADSLQLSDGGLISGVSLGKGNAGNFDIQAGRVTLEGGGLIHTSTSGAGAAGSIALAATESVQASGRLDASRFAGFAPRGTLSSGVVSKATLELNPNLPALGNAGSISVTAPQVLMRDGAEISTSAAKNALGGTIAISAADIDLSRSASLSSSSGGTGNAGSIALRARDSLRVGERAVVSTEARSADGGDIDIQAGTLVYVRSGSITTSVGSGSGNGGNIAIDPQFVVLDAGRIIANAYGGNGGNIRIAAQNYVASPDSVVEASSQLGIAGTVEISAPNSNVGAGLKVLPASFLDASRLLQGACAARAGGKTSSLVAAGRGGMPVAPDGLLASSVDLVTGAASISRQVRSPDRGVRLAADPLLRIGSLRCGG